MHADVLQIMSFTMISSFSMISSNFLGPVRNSRLKSFGIISLTTNISCASSIVLNWCSYSAAFGDHAVSLSLSSFASLERREFGLQRYRRVVRRLGRIAVEQCLPCHEPMTWLRLSDLRDRGSGCAFCRVGQGHCLLIVQLDMLVVFSMATVSPRLRRSEHSLRDPLNQLSSLMCPGRYMPATQRPLVQSLQLVCCLTSSLGRVVLRPSIVVCRQSLMLSMALARPVMTRLLVRLVEGFLSSAATVLSVLPILQLCADNSSARC